MSEVDPAESAPSTVFEVEPAELIPSSADQQASREAFIQKYGQSPWPVPDAEEWYWRKTTRPVDLLSAWRYVFLDPFLERMYQCPPEDPTYGRYSLPFSPHEKSIREEPKYTCWDQRVFLKDRGDGVFEPAEEETSEWIWYQVWWDQEASKRTELERDLLFCHGLGEYGGAFAKRAQKFLDAGYRVIVLDLPSHGRSTGFHAHITNYDSLAHAIHIVLADVTTQDLAAGRAQRPVAVGGQSMGGFTTVLYGLLYHSTPLQSRPIIERLPKAKLIGLVLLCPMLAISPDSRPAKPIELFATMISSFAGRLALAEAHKGKSSQDPWEETKFQLDPQNYPGSLRVATGLGVLTAVDYTDNNMSELEPPFLVIHGGSDRVTHPSGSIKLFKTAKSTQKSINIHPFLEHVILRVGRDEEDDQPRQKVITDIIEWIDQVKGTS